MKQITEQDLTLLYYGEHQDPKLASMVAQSKELSARFSRLSRELELIDAYQPPERAEKYGAEVWNRISAKLGETNSGSENKLKAWWANFSQPRLSLAGIFSLAIVAALAFMLGRNTPGPMPSELDTGSQHALSGLDRGRLLSSSVAGHLEQLNVVLTEFANTERPAVNEAEWAMDMLVANRLYRQSASNEGNRRIASFLESLEPLLIELAYQAHNASDTARNRMQLEVRDDLLFKIRVMNNQLKTRQLST